MSGSDKALREDRDAIHVLPLSIIPLQTKTLQQARLVKNAKLQGMVELFSEGEAGSGQIPPEQLVEFFDFNDERARDLEIVTALAALPSYDVYSLRLELRSLGIKVEDHKQLSLSPGKAQELAGYMNTFTRPLIAQIYGDTEAGERSLDELIHLFLDPDKEAARKNLSDLAESLGLGLAEIPMFLERYADVYLSLAYYAATLDRIAATLDRISKPLAQATEVLEKIRKDTRYQRSQPIMKACDRITKRIVVAKTNISHILDAFRARTQDMWEDITGPKFHAMEKVIMDYQRGIGGNLCALVVKMDAWEKLAGKGSLGNCVQFVMSELAVGVDKMPDLDLSVTTAEGPKDDGSGFEWVA
jgi:hypothetical protein